MEVNRKSIEREIVSGWKNPENKSECIQVMDDS
jgi:hypothetical protein